MRSTPPDCYPIYVFLSVLPSRFRSPLPVFSVRKDYRVQDSGRPEDHHQPLHGVCAIRHEERSEGNVTSRLHSCVPLVFLAVGRLGSIPFVFFRLPRCSVFFHVCRYYKWPSFGICPPDLSFPSVSILESVFFVSCLHTE